MKYRLLFSMIGLFVILGLEQVEAKNLTSCDALPLSVVVRNDSINPSPEDLLSPSITALPAGFAHNDYLHDEPLRDALQNGYVYIEADIHLIEGELYVSQNKPTRLDPEKTLVKLYLDPLYRIYKANGNRFYDNFEEPLVLSVDIKTEACPTYVHLRHQLNPYREMLTHFKNGTTTEGALTVLISGNRPIEEMAKDTDRIICVDGRITDVGKNIPNDLMPIISDNFTKVFGKKKKPEQFKEEDLAKLRAIVKSIRQEGKKLRFWKTQESTELWAFLLKEGVNLINTDELENFRTFYLEKENKQREKNKRAK